MEFIGMMLKSVTQKNNRTDREIPRQNATPNLMEMEMKMNTT